MILAPMIFFMARRTPPSASVWASVIAPNLLPFVLKKRTGSEVWWHRFIMPLCIVFLSLALAGPTAQKMASDLHYNKAPVIIALELTQDMLKDDIAPNRLKRAVFKISDLLAALKGSEIALVAFAGDAHVVVPLTDDYHTIFTLAKTLSPDVMPKAGIDYQALFSLTNSIASRHMDAKLLVITSTPPQAAGSTFHPQDVHIPTIFWSFGSTIATSPDYGAVQATLDQSDIKTIVDALSDMSFKLSSKKYPYDTWADLGPYFLIIAISLFVAAFFCTNMSLGILALMLISAPEVEAISFSEWFLNKDQRAQRAYTHGDFAQAAELYSDDLGKGSAYFRQGLYDEAIKHFRRVLSSDGHYNLGNALAKKGNYQEAIEAYKQALSLDSNHKDAQFNKTLLEDLLKKQQQEQHNQQQEKSPDQSKDKQEQSKPSQDQEKNQQDGEQKPHNNEAGQNQDQENAPNKSPSAQEKKDTKETNEKKPEQSQKPSPSEQKQQNKEGDEKAAPASEQPAKESSKQEGLDRKTRYYFDQLEQHNSLYLKRKFRYESEKNQGLRK